MQNVLLAFPDYTVADPDFVTVSFSGGSWLSALPLSNLLQTGLDTVARSTDATLGSTQFLVDLGVGRTVQALALVGHNGSRSCSIRARGYNSASAPVVGTDTPAVDSGWVSLYQVAYSFGSIPYGASSFWDGKLSEEDASIFPMPWLYMISGGTVTRWWLFEVNDTGNADGYFEVSRVVIAGGWQPTINFVPGAGLGYEDPSVVQQTLGGTKVVELRRKRRVATFSFDLLEEDEALTYAFDMQARLGISGQLLFAWDPSDTYHAHRRTFLATMRRLSYLQAAAYLHQSVAFEIEEVL